MNVPLLMYGTECILLWQTIQSVSGLALMSINMINHAKSACINVATLQPPGNIWIMLFHTFINCAYFAVTLKKQFSVCKVLSIIANSTQKKTVTSNGWDLWWIQKRSNISKVHFLRFAYLISVGMWPHDYLECCAFKGCDTLPHTFNSFSSIPFELDLFWSCVWGKIFIFQPQTYLTLRSR